MPRRMLLKRKLLYALVSAWQQKIKKENLDWSIGVITPFSAQIAAITYLAHQQNLDIEPR